MKKLLIILPLLVLLAFKPIEGLLYSNFTYAGVSGLVAYYPFNGNANDSIGAKNGSVTDAVLTTDRNGNPNKAYDFNGTSAYIIIADNDTFSFTNGSSDLPFTISFWANLDNISATQYVFSKFTSDGNYEWRIVIGSGKISLLLFSQNTIGNIIYRRYIVNDMVDWHHFVFTYDASSLYTGINCYFDNVLTNEEGGLIGTYNYMTNTSAQVVIGQYYNLGSFYDGKLDEIKIYNRVLTTDEITALYNE